MRSDLIRQHDAIVQARELFCDRDQGRAVPKAGSDLLAMGEAETLCAFERGADGSFEESSRLT